MRRWVGRRAGPRLAARSHSCRNRRTSTSSGASARSVTRSRKAPPAATGDSCAGSPTSSTFAPTSRAWAARRVEFEGAGHGGFVDDDQLPAAQPPPVQFRPDLAGASGEGAGPQRGAGAAQLALREASSARRWSCRACSVSHLAVFSVGTPTASARTSAAAAEGASPTTLPGPNAASHAARTPAMVVDFPVPAAPTSTSRARPEVTTRHTASACSAVSRRPSARPGNGAPAAAAATTAGTCGSVGGAAGGEEAFLRLQHAGRGVDGGVPGPQTGGTVGTLQRRGDASDLGRGELHRGLQRHGGDAFGGLGALVRGGEPDPVQLPQRLGQHVGAGERRPPGGDRIHHHGRRVLEHSVLEVGRVQGGQVAPVRQRGHPRLRLADPGAAPPGVASRGPGRPAVAAPWRVGFARVACCRSRITSAAVGCRPWEAAKPAIRSPGGGVDRGRALRELLPQRLADPGHLPRRGRWSGPGAGLPSPTPDPR